MQPNFIYGGSGILLGLATGILFSKILKIEDVKNAIEKGFMTCVTTSAKAVDANDSSVSHTRIMNLSWCYFAMFIVAYTVVKQVPVQPAILIFMGAAMGFNMTQTVANKIQERKANAE